MAVSAVVGELATVSINTLDIGSFHHAVVRGQALDEIVRKSDIDQMEACHRPSRLGEEKAEFRSVEGNHVIGMYSILIFRHRTVWAQAGWNIYGNGLAGRLVKVLG